MNNFTLIRLQRGSAKSVAARFLNGALKNEENSAEEPARKMSKHQQKVKARKEKKVSDSSIFAIIYLIIGFFN